MSPFFGRRLQKSVADVFPCDLEYTTRSDMPQAAAASLYVTFFVEVDICSPA